MFNKQWFIRFITANIEYKNDIALLRKLVIINGLVLAIIMLFSIFSLYNLLRGEYLVGALDGAGLIVCLIAYYQLYVNKRLDFTVITVSITLMIFLWALAFVGQNREYSLIWTFFFPLFVIMLNGRKLGLRLVVIFYIVLLTMACLGIGEWQQGAWSFTSFLRFFLASVVMVYTCYYSELAMDHSYQSYRHAAQEEKRLLAERNALMQETLAQKNKLLNDVSHEFRTPLAVMRVQLEALQDDVVQDKAKAYGSLQSKISELDKLIHDLSQASKVNDNLVTEPAVNVDLMDVLNQLVAQYQTRFANAQLRFTANIGTSPCWVLGNKENLTSLFDKLLDNSVRYTHASGQVSLGLNIMRDRVEVTLEDSAPGVAESEREQLFEALYRVDQSRSRATGGAGLGLAIAKSIVEAHQGDITLNASSIGGLQISVILPLA